MVNLIMVSLMHLVSTMQSALEKDIEAIIHVYSVIHFLG